MKSPASSGVTTTTASPLARYIEWISLRMESVASVSASVRLRTISRSWERLTVRGVVALSMLSARRQLGAVALRTM